MKKARCQMKSEPMKFRKVSELHPLPENPRTINKADFSRQALLHDFRKATNRHVRETSLVKHVVFPSYTHLIYYLQFRVVIGL